MKKSTMSAIAAVSVAGALTIGLGAVSAWYTNWDTKTWFGRGGGTQTAQPVQPDVPDTPDKSVSGDGAVITDGENHGISLLSAKLPVAAYAANGVSEQADTAYVITATIEPSVATNQAVDWSVAWANAQSTWASGKTVTDYVTVTPSSSGSRTATVECKQAFGEQVIVTCRSQDNNSISATCTVDYTQKVVSSTLGINTHFGGPEYNFSTDKVMPINYYQSSNNMSAWNFKRSKIEVSPCTISDSYTWTLRFRPTDYIRDLVSYVSDGSFEYTISRGSLIGSDEPVWLMSDNNIPSIFGVSAFKSVGFKEALSNDYIANRHGCMTIESIITGEYGTYTETYKATFYPDSVVTSVTSVSLSDTSIKF